jgi:hypothetical protein
MPFATSCALGLLPTYTLPLAGGREVVVLWVEGGVTSQQGDISDEQWEILTPSFTTTGRIAILGDRVGEAWTADFLFLAWRLLTRYR